MKKIGIITFHRPVNYGAILQAYALEKKLNDLGYVAEIIDYRFNRIEKYRKTFIVSEYMNRFKKPFTVLKRFLRDLYYSIFSIIKRTNFDKFMKDTVILSNRKYINFEELELHCQEYNTYIVGSDLVWNVDMAEGVNPVCFLAFVCDKTKTRLAYASSFGTVEISNSYKDKYIEMLENLDYISVREKTAVDILANLTSRKIVNVLDPTLLLTSDEWKIISKPLKIDSNYLLVYMVEFSLDLIEIAKKIATEKKLKIVSFDFKKIYGKKSTNVCYSGPDHFIDLFANASCVLTNSFHGAAFSVIFEKEFWCIPHTTRGARMIDLMNLLGLTDRIIYKVDSINYLNINYQDVSKKLEKEKEISIQFLLNSIK